MAAATEKNKDKLIQQSRSSVASRTRHLLYGSYCCWPVSKPVARLSRPSPVYPCVLTCVYRKAVAPSTWRRKSIRFFASNGTRTLSRLNYSLSSLRPAGAVDVFGRSAELLPLQAGQTDCRIFLKTSTGWTHRACNCGPRASSTDDHFNAVSTGMWMAAFRRSVLAPSSWHYKSRKFCWVEVMQPEV
jgi:hypothetical protein